MIAAESPRPWAGPPPPPQTDPAPAPSAGPLRPRAVVRVPFLGKGVLGGLALALPDGERRRGRAAFLLLVPVRLRLLLLLVAAHLTLGHGVPPAARYLR